MDPEDDDLGKLERFIRAGGDLSSVPETTWAQAGGTAFKDKVTRFRAAGGNPAEIKVPRSTLQSGTPMVGMLTPAHLARNEREVTANIETGYPAPYRGERAPVGTPDPVRDTSPLRADHRLYNSLSTSRDMAGNLLAGAMDTGAQWGQRVDAAVKAPIETYRALPERMAARPSFLGKLDEALGGAVQIGAQGVGAVTSPVTAAPVVGDALGAVMTPFVKAGEHAKEATGSSLAQQGIEQVLPAALGVGVAKGIPAIRGQVAKARAGGITPDLAALAARDRAALVPEVRFEKTSGMAADAAKGPLRADPISVRVNKRAPTSPELPGTVPASIDLAKPAVAVADGKVGLGATAGAVVDPAAGVTRGLLPRPAPEIALRDAGIPGSRVAQARGTEPSPRPSPGGFDPNTLDADIKSGAVTDGVSSRPLDWANFDGERGGYMAWRGLGEAEFNKLLSGSAAVGEKGFRGASVATSHPQKAVRFASKDGKYLVEFGGLRKAPSGERAGKVLGGEDIARAWKYQDGKFVPVELPGLTRPASLVTEASIGDVGTPGAATARPLPSQAVPDIRYRSTLGTEEGFGPGTGPRFAPGEQPGIKADPPAPVMATDAPVPSAPSAPPMGVSQSPARAPGPLSTMTKGGPARSKRGPLSKKAGSVDPALFSDFGNAVGKLVEPARGLWEKGTDAVSAGAAKVIDKVPGGAAIRGAVDDALTPVLNREMVGPRVTKGGSTEAMLSEQKRHGDVEFVRGAGERLIREVEKAQQKMTDAEVEAAHAWAAGEADALPTTMRPEAKAAYEKLSAFIDSTRQSLLDRGLISPEVYAEYPRFLSRVFREKLESGRKPLGQGSGKTVEPNLARADAWNVTAKMPMEDVQKHLAGLTDVQLQPINLPGGRVFLKFSPTDAGKASVDTFATRVREAYKAGKSDLSSAATDAIRKGDDVRTTKSLVRATDDTPAPSEVLKIESPLPAELRAELGEYRDTTTSASLTINAAARKLANYDNLVRMEQIGKRNGFVADKPKGGAVPSGFVEITSDRFGPLKGKIMDKEVHDAMFEAMDPKQRSALQKLASSWKRGSILYNLGSHGRNIISIPILAEQAGVNMVANSKHWTEAAKNLYQRGKRYEEYVREGVIRQDLASAEAKLRARETMTPKERAALDNAIDTLIDVLGGDVTSPLKSIDGVKHARAFLEEAYAIPDDWLRATKYEQLRTSGMSKMDALSELNASTYNYNQQGPLTRKVTQYPVAGPAANFLYETYRITKNNAMRHPGRIVRSLVFLEAIRQALRARSDHTPEEEKAYETAYGGAAPWRELPGASTIFPLGRDTDTGNPEVYNSRSVDPLGPLKEGPRGGLEGAEWGKWGADAALGGESPIMSALGIWMRDGKNSYGRQVYEEDDSAREKAWKLWRETHAPPLMSRQGDRIAASFRGEQYSPSQPKQDPVEAVASVVSGFTIGEFDPDLVQNSLNRGMRAIESKERRTYNRRASAGEDAKADKAVDRLHSAVDEWSRRSDELDSARKSKPDVVK